MGAAVYGSSSDLWGTTLLPADVNGSGFGVAISSKLIAQILSVAFSSRIDQVTVTVYSQGILLPVEVDGFSARRGQQGNILTWTEDIGSGLVVVQRSADGLAGWQQLEVKDVTGGPQSYTDVRPLSGIGFYRLCFVSPGGGMLYSPVSAVGGKSAAIVRVYPNPVVDQININSPVSFTRLVLRSARGQTLWRREYAAGVGTASIPVAGLPKGIYFVQVDGTNYQLLKN
ncbi:T9SS type A sorting domain-containing protein [Puia sp. P3]|uniref:T9SS type A sorting domain-containing protein n=1 Tax=Puia sp. P3 TaxID=3423952 RepID=UPI003D67B61A